MGNQLETPTYKKRPLLTESLRIFLVSMILANVSGGMYGALLPLYLKELNASIAQIGLFFTLSQIIPLALQILGGWMSDSLGRLKSIAIGSVAGVLAYVVMIISPTWQWVLLSMAINAITHALVGPSFAAFIAEQSEEQNRAKVFGVVQSIYMIVVVIGPPLGGWLAQAYGFRFMLIIAAIIYLIATVIRVFMARTAAKGAEANPTPLTFNSLKLNMGMMISLVLAGGLITWMILTDGVRDIAFSMSFNLIPVFLNEVGGMTLVQIGWMEAAYGVAAMITNYPGGWLADKLGERVNLVIGYLLFFAAMIVFVVGNGLTAYTVSWVLFGIGDGLMGPAYQSLISKAVPEKLRGTAFGIMSTSLGFFSLPAPAIGGKLYERFGPLTPFRITAAFSLFAILPVWLKFKQTQKEKDRIKEIEASDLYKSIQAKPEVEGIG